MCTRVVAARIAFACGGCAVVGKDCDGYPNARRVEAHQVDKHGGQDGEAHIVLWLSCGIRIFYIFLPAASVVNIIFSTSSSHNLWPSL